MEQKIKVSVLVDEYKSEKQLSKMLEGIISQKVDFPYEVNVAKRPVSANLEAVLGEFQNKNPNIRLKMDNGSGKEFSLGRAEGEYLAFCYRGDYWRDCEKLKKQVTMLDTEDSYIATVHDICIINDEGVPYSYAEQQAYKRRCFSMDRRYTWEQLQHFLYPGAISTLVCRNIFRKDSVSAFVKAKQGNGILRLFAVLALEGVCCNLYNDQMVERSMSDEAKANRDFETLAVARRELDQICEFAHAQYGIELDPRYRLIQLAVDGFECYKAGKKSQEDLEKFMALYDAAYDAAYDLPVDQTHHIAEQKTLFDNLRYKLFCYQIKKGTAAEDVLLKYLRPLNDEMCIEYMLRSFCRLGRANQLVRQRLLEKAQDKANVQHTVYNRVMSAPIRKVGRKVKNLGKRFHRKFKKVVTLNLRRKGYSAYMANEWYDSVRINLLTDKSAALKDKIWCYRRGFMPWRIFQYGLTAENYESFLSDRDYMYLHQINNSYKKWIEDKMTLRYVLDPFKEYLPQYYFQIIRREGYTVILPLMDCPDGYQGTFDDLFRLLRERGNLALKAASGTHGIGFYKMSYEDGKYYMNNEESSEYEIRRTILNFRSYYVVTEYINMHQQIKDLYAGSVNTLRIMMINRDGYNPQILDAYMRIGSSTTGTTDNVAFGGVFCKIDVDTGRYGNAEQSKDHVLVACPRHPDTGTLIEGIIPHWELIKDQVVAMSRYMGQLEYLGFDVVCTPDSFVILEINSHQDLHRYIYYDPRIKQFYFDKLKYKKKLYKK